MVVFVCSQSSKDRGRCARDINLYHTLAILYYRFLYVPIFRVRGRKRKIAVKKGYPRSGYAKMAYLCEHSRYLTEFVKYCMCVLRYYKSWETRKVLHQGRFWCRLISNKSVSWHDRRNERGAFLRNPKKSPKTFFLFSHSSEPVNFADSYTRIC